MQGRAFHIYAHIHFMANGTRFIAFWLSISTHITSEALNLISTFNLMLIVNNVQNTLQIEVDLCRIESQNIRDVYVKCSSSHAQNTLQPYHQLMKLRIMTVCIELKVLL